MRRGILKALKSKLSARLLILTAAFVMLAEVLIYVPSIAQYRRTWLEERLGSAQIAALALEATSSHMLSADLARELLTNAGVAAVVLKRGDARRLILRGDMPVDIAAMYDLRTVRPWTLVSDAFETMILLADDRLIEVTGSARKGSGEYVQIMLYPGELKRAMIDYSRNILLLSVVISLVTAGLVYVALTGLMVRPIRRITRSVVAFRQAPEAISSRLNPSARSDEIGVVERELAAMQADLQTALTQKTRLANLGAAVAKINHDLRNILAGAQLLSDRLATVEDPTVRALSPRFMRTIDRAINLCAATLAYGRAPETTLHPTTVNLRALVAEVAAALGLMREDGGKLRFCNAVDDAMTARVDGEQFFRVLMNLCRNARDAIEAAPAMASPCDIRVTARQDDAATVIEITDTGPGLPAAARAHLFEPFRGSATAGGSGLGLAIAKEIVEAHGGAIALVDGSETGATFRITLPR